MTSDLANLPRSSRFTRSYTSLYLTVPFLSLCHPAVVRKSPGIPLLVLFLFLVLFLRMRDILLFLVGLKRFDVRLQGILGPLQ
mmetsp:Transcript_12190/g.24313  ORF Transcript_12190/g.24313 Transcript_12190/m.24313 type:complete len:83 (-) Transcript_12190:802-1050(-)